MPSENHTKWSNSMVFGFEKILDSAMDIAKLNLANLVGKVVDEIMEYQIWSTISDIIMSKFHVSQP